ncbi:MAG: hypothetical protein A3F10_07095 [Coxiella sp. RIFCSPHIGHO2_12_FULL_42_15]|nr:MAG: hypothetical protein A3F10_07095 [Coxiella sp. RIFCSPHIGHO2_12_FULL_42_15]
MEPRLEYKGISAYQQIAETIVTITRDAQPKRKDANGKRLPIAHAKGPEAGELRKILVRLN